MSDNPYEIVFFRGVRLDRMTAQAISQMEEKLGYDLTIIQGSYNTGVGASAGTHDGGGAVDLSSWDASRKVRVGREVGFAMWYRSPSEGPWNAHCHGILIGNDKASWGAKQQVAAYKNGRNGLANNAADSFGWRPSPVRAYRFVVDKAIAISLSNLRVDFINAREGKRNEPSHRGRVVQRLLNRKLGSDLSVDGVIGMQTLSAWRRWERKIDGEGRQGIPDKTSLRRLFRFTIYFVKS